MARSNRFNSMTLESLCDWASKAPSCGEGYVWLTDTTTPHGWSHSESQGGHEYCHEEVTVYISLANSVEDGEGAIYVAQWWVPGAHLVKGDDFLWRHEKG